LKCFIDKKPFELKIFLALFAFFLLAVLTSYFWHIAPVVNYVGSAAEIREYDRIAFDGNSCFTLEITPNKFDFEKKEEILAYTKEKLIASDSVDLPEEKLMPIAGLSIEAFDSASEGDYGNAISSLSELLGSILAGKATIVERQFATKEVCFDASDLSEGDHKIEIFSYYNNLFYHLEKKQGKKPKRGEISIELKEVENDSLEFGIENYPNETFLPVEIFVNEKLDHRFYPKPSESQFSEKIELRTGENTVEVKAGTVTQAMNVEKEEEFSMPLVFGLFLFVLSLFVFCCFVFPEYQLHKKMPLAFASVAGLFIFVVFVLGNLDVLNVFSFLAVFLILLAGIAFYYRHNFSLSKPKSIHKMDRVVLFTIVIFVVVSLGFHFFNFHHMTYWNGFYERNSSMIREQNALPSIDALSYLGRGYTFVPGYFYFNTGLAWLTGLEGQALFSLIMSFSNLLFLFSTFYLGRALGLHKKQSALFSLLIMSESFLLTAVTLSPRHALSFSLLALSLALYFDKKHPALCGIVLGMTAFVQAPLILFFPMFAFIAGKKTDWKRLATVSLIGGALFVVLFAPNIAKFGMPYQVESGSWGYLIKYPINFLWRDFVALLAFFFTFYLIDLVRKRIKLTNYTKKLMIALGLGFVIQVSVTYRFNIITGLIFGLLLALWFPYKKLEDIHFERLCFIFVLIALWMSLSNVNSIQDIGYGPMVYLGEATSTNTKILSDPLFGHSIAYFAKRPVLADLMVEYADQEKLNDAYSFLEDKDYGVLDKYGLDYTVNQSNYVNREAMYGKPTKEAIEFDEIDKIYSNTFLFIHRNRRQWN